MVLKCDNAYLDVQSERKLYVGVYDKLLYNWATKINKQENKSHFFR